MKRYFSIWLRFTDGTTQISFASRLGAAIFLIGKIFRFLFFLFFIYLVSSRTQKISGYTLWQMIFFYLTFNLIDTIPQFFLRDVYRFRQQIVNGYFDHTLLKPMSPLFKSLFGGSDILDLITLVFLIVLLVINFQHLSGVTFITVILYGLLLLNSLLIALAFHICILCLGILTTEVDNAMMLYRDTTQMGRFPIDIYKEPLRGILTFAIPVGIMMTIPAKVLMGIISWPVISISIFIGVVFFLLSILWWKYALRAYSSASS